MGTRARLRGRQNRFGFAVESYDLGDAHDTADFAPVYPASEELPQKQLRGLVEARSWTSVPMGIRCRPASSPRTGCRCVPTRWSHFIARARLDEAERGRRRLAFDELLVLQLALARRAAEREALVAQRSPPPGELVGALPRGAPVHAH